jgi:hypothetical protein
LEFSSETGDFPIPLISSVVTSKPIFSLAAFPSLSDFVSCFIGAEGDPPFSRLFVLSQNQVPQLRARSRADPRPTPRPIARFFGFDDLFELAVEKPFAPILVVAPEGLVVEDDVD